MMLIFVAVPFTKKINPRERQVAFGFRQELSARNQYLREAGQEYLLMNVKGGAKILCRQRIVLQWKLGIDEKALLMAILENPPSDRVHIELGYATAKNLSSKFVKRAANIPLS